MSIGHALGHQAEGSSGNLDRVRSHPGGAAAGSCIKFKPFPRMSICHSRDGGGCCREQGSAVEAHNSSGIRGTKLHTSKF